VIIAGERLNEKIVSAGRRCNGREATARLSNQHARRVRYPEPLLQLLDHVPALLQ
jgi:hypothetical protein